MMIELSPALLSSLERVNELHLQGLKEDDHLKARWMFEERGRELMFLLMGLTQAVETQRQGG